MPETYHLTLDKLLQSNVLIGLLNTNITGPVAKPIGKKHIHTEGLVELDAFLDQTCFTRIGLFGGKHEVMFLLGGALSVGSKKDPKDKRHRDFFGSGGGGRPCFRDRRVLFCPFCGLCTSRHRPSLQALQPKPLTSLEVDGSRRFRLRPSTFPKGHQWLASDQTQEIPVRPTWKLPEGLGKASG